MFPNYTGVYPQVPIQFQQQRLMEMEQQYPQYAQQSTYQPQKPMFMKCRAVTSLDEAKASIIELDGSINVFTDIGNKKIYTKQINLDGTATLNTYTLQEDTQPQQAQPEAPKEQPEELPYVRQEELEAVCRNFSQQLKELQDELSGYKRAFATLQAEQKSAAKKGDKK